VIFPRGRGAKHRGKTPFPVSAALSHRGKTPFPVSAALSHRGKTPFPVSAALSPRGKTLFPVSAALFPRGEIPFFREVTTSSGEKTAQNAFQEPKTPHIVENGGLWAVWHRLRRLKWVVRWGPLRWGVDCCGAMREPKRTLGVQLR
jgi:hypothetical protein